MKVKWWIYLVVALVIILFPLTLNYLLQFDGPVTTPDLGNKEWLGFWAAYAGSILGGVATFFAVTMTLKHSEKLRKESQEHQLEIKKREVQPIFDIFPASIEKSIVLTKNNVISLNQEDNFFYGWNLIIASKKIDMYFTKNFFHQGKFNMNNKRLVNFKYKEKNIYNVDFIDEEEKDSFEMFNDLKIKKNYEFMNLYVYNFKNIGTSAAILALLHVQVDNQIQCNLNSSFVKLISGSGIPKDFSSYLILALDNQTLENLKNVKIMILFQNMYRNYYKQDAEIEKDGFSSTVQIVMKFPQEISKEEYEVIYGKKTFTDAISKEGLAYVP